MLIKNNISATVIVFGWHKHSGPGEDVIIHPGESKEVDGPYMGKKGGRNGYLSIPGTITCQETPDDDNGYQITEEMSLQIKSEGDPDIGVTVTMYSEEEVAI